MPKNNLTKEEKIAFDKLSNATIPSASEIELFIRAAKEQRVDFELLHKNFAKSDEEIIKGKRSHNDPSKKKPHRRGTISY